jgi:altronate hydrolase
VVLAETPEIYGAEHLLLERCASLEVGQKLVERIQWWQEQARRLGFSLDNNPTPGNKAGGLTTIYEKSLGAIAKGGSTPLQAVVEYAEWIEAHGLVFMDSPGNDPISITGQLAGGCNMIAFTTGRGSVYGSILAPCIKIATTSGLYERMEDDMDFNAGVILAGAGMEETAKHLFDRIIASASGERAKSEWSGFREGEFVPWQPGAVV